MWPQLILFVVSVLISFALRPKAVVPPPSGLDDVNAPRAEPGSLVPIIYGTVVLKSANTVWYGDLSYLAIKKKKQVIGYRYFLGIHLILCKGPIDKLKSIAFGGRKVWTGDVTSNQEIYINEPDIFGGEEKEGGVQGYVDIEMGGDSQTANPYLTSNITGLMPAFRGVVGAVFKSFYVGAGTPYPKAPEFELMRIPAKDWLPDLANINGAANPAHMLYELISSQPLGMGYDLSSVNLESLETAAQTLYDEGFGLSAILTSEDDFESFIQTITTHTDSMFFVHPEDGKYTFKLLRDDSTGTLQEFNQSNCSLLNFERASFAELVNEIVVKFRPQSTSKDDTITVQDLAVIQAQGAVISQTINYPCIDNVGIAQKVAMRDLRQRSTPLARIKLSVNRQAWNTSIGDCINFSWEDTLSISSMRLRVASVNRGSFESSKIVVECVEDIFGLDETTYIQDQVSTWVDPILSAPTSATIHTEEASYWDLVRSETIPDYAIDLGKSTFAAYVEYPITTALSFEFWNKWYDPIEGIDNPYIFKDQANFTPTAQLALELGKFDSTLNFYNLKGVFANTNQLVGNYITIGTNIHDMEIIRIDAIDFLAMEIEIGRGCLDTVPKAHLLDSKIYFNSDRKALDSELYYTNFSQTFKGSLRILGPINTTEILDSSSYDITTIQGRSGLPYPIGCFKVQGVYYGENFTGDLSISWTLRNKSLQISKLVSHDQDTAIDGEDLVYAKISIYDEDGDSTGSGTTFSDNWSLDHLTENTFIYSTPSNEIDSSGTHVSYTKRRLSESLRIIVESAKRDDGDEKTSIQYVDHTVKRSGYGFYYGEKYGE
jgi:hypothetical protein